MTPRWRRFEPLVPRLRWSLVQLAARDATDAAIAKPGTPIVRVDASDFHMPGAPFTRTKAGVELEIGLPRLRAIGFVIRRKAK